jgi:hypothetical protein
VVQLLGFIILPLHMAFIMDTALLTLQQSFGVLQLSPLCWQDAHLPLWQFSPIILLLMLQQFESVEQI